MMLLLSPKNLSAFKLDKQVNSPVKPEFFQLTLLSSVKSYLSHNNFESYTRLCHISVRLLQPKNQEHITHFTFTPLHSFPIQICLLGFY